MVRGWLRLWLLIRVLVLLRLISGVFLSVFFVLILCVRVILVVWVLGW